MRIAYVVHSFDVGGLERCAAHLANQLDENRYQTQIISLTDIRRGKDWINRQHVGFHELHKPEGNDREIVRRLGQLLINEEVDIVHSHNWGTLLESVLAVRHCRKMTDRPIQLVHAEHGLELDRYRTSGLRRLLRQGLMAWSFRQCDATIAIAHCVSRWMRKLCRAPQDRHWLIPNGVADPSALNVAQGELLDRRALKTELGIDPNGFLLTSIGRAVPMKGYDLAIQAITRLSAVGRNVHWLLAGDGPALSTLERLAKQNGVDKRVHLLGKRSDLGKLLTASEVFLNTSHTEAMNLAILEAMACGCGVVASNVGDNAVLIGADQNSDSVQVAGQIFAAGDVEELVTLVCRWQDDSMLPEQFGRAGRQRYLDNYQLQSMVDRYSYLYDSLAKRRGTA